MARRGAALRDWGERHLERCSPCRHVAEWSRPAPLLAPSSSSRSPAPTATAAPATGRSPPRSRWTGSAPRPAHLHRAGHARRPSARSTCPSPPSRSTTPRATASGTARTRPRRRWPRPPTTCSRVLPAVRWRPRRRPGRQPGDGAGRRQGGRRCRDRRRRRGRDDRVPRRTTAATTRSIVYSKAAGPRGLAAAGDRDGAAVARLRRPRRRRRARRPRRPGRRHAARPTPRDYEEVRRLGRGRSVDDRTGDQTAIAAVLRGQPDADVPQRGVRPARRRADGPAADDPAVRPDRRRRGDLVHPDLAAEVRGRLLAAVPGHRRAAPRTATTGTNPHPETWVPLGRQPGLLRLHQRPRRGDLAVRRGAAPDASATTRRSC